MKSCLSFLVSLFIILSCKNSFPQPSNFNVYPGFPLQYTYSSQFQKHGGIFCNMDSDADMEIVFGSGENLYAVNLDGSSVPGWPKTFAQFYEIGWSPSFGDIDGDGEGEIVAGVGGFGGGMICAFEKDGSEVSGFPIPFETYVDTPVLADVDKDNILEIVIGSRSGKMFIFKGDGSIYPGWPYQMDGFTSSSASVGDINNDGVMDVLCESLTKFYAWNKDGKLLPGFPIEAYAAASTGIFSYSAPLLVDIDNDDTLEIAFCSLSDEIFSAGGIAYLIRHDGTFMPGWPNFSDFWMFSTPIAADIDGDKELEIIVADYLGSTAPAFHIYAYNIDGSMVEGFPHGPFWGIANQLTIADIDNDNQYEIIFDENIQQEGRGRYQAIELDGSPVEGWPLYISGNTSIHQPLLGDLNNDGFLDLILGGVDNVTDEVFIYAWNTNLPYIRQTIVNPMYQFDATHNGLYIDPTITSANDDIITNNDMKIPVNYILAKNYPNPFNPLTKIDFNLPEQSILRIEIVNILGEVVDVLTDNVFEKGNHSKFWNAGNNTSGIYLAILKAESIESGKSYTRTIKMSLIR